MARTEPARKIELSIDIGAARIYESLVTRALFDPTFGQNIQAGNVEAIRATLSEMGVTCSSEDIAWVLQELEANNLQAVRDVAAAFSNRADIGV